MLSGGAGLGGGGENEWSSLFRGIFLGSLRMVGRTMVSQRGPHPSSLEPLDMLPDTANGTLQMQLRLWTSRWGGYPESFGQVPSNRMGP